MSERRTELGKVASVRFGRERGILTLWLQIDFGTTGQGFGGFALDTYDRAKARRVGHAAGTDFVLRLLDLFGVDTLEQIKGRTVYVVREGGDPIIGLELPAFDGGRSFLLSTWTAEWLGEQP